MTDTSSTRPQMGDELLPCPFCEGTHVVVCKNDMQHTAYCTDCEAEGPLALSQEDAITAWNRRASSQMGDEELRKVIGNAIAWVQANGVPEGRLDVIVDEIIGHPAMSRVRASLPQPPAGSRGDGEAKRLSFVIERDRARCAEILTAVRRAIRGHEWLRLGRGSYEYDDERWKEEFGAAIDGIEEALKPLAAMARDWTDCPTKREEILAARASTPAQSVLVEAIDAAFNERIGQKAGEHTPSILVRTQRRELAEIAAKAIRSHASSQPAPVVDAALLKLAEDYGCADTSEGLFLSSLHAALTGSLGPSAAEIVSDLFGEIAAMRDALREIIRWSDSGAEPKTLTDACQVAEDALQGPPGPKRRSLTAKIAATNALHASPQPDRESEHD